MYKLHSAFSFLTTNSKPYKKRTVLINSSKLPFDIYLFNESFFLQNNQTGVIIHVTKRFKNITFQLQLYKKTFGTSKTITTITNPIENIQQQSTDITNSKNCDKYYRLNDLNLIFKTLSKNFCYINKIQQIKKERIETQEDKFDLIKQTEQLKQRKVTYHYYIAEPAPIKWETHQKPKTLYPLLDMNSLLFFISIFFSFIMVKRIFTKRIFTNPLIKKIIK